MGQRVLRAGPPTTNTAESWRGQRERNLELHSIWPGALSLTAFESSTSVRQFCSFGFQDVPKQQPFPHVPVNLELSLFGK